MRNGRETFGNGRYTLPSENFSIQTLRNGRETFGNGRYPLIDIFLIKLSSNSLHIAFHSNSKPSNLKKTWRNTFKMKFSFVFGLQKLKIVVTSLEICI